MCAKVPRAEPGVQENITGHHNTVDQLLQDVLEINRKGVEAGHASVMLVTLEAVAPPPPPPAVVQDARPAVLEQPAAPLAVPDAPPKGVAPATQRNAEGSGHEIMLQVCRSPQQGTHQRNG